MRLVEADYYIWHNVEKDGLPKKEGNYLCVLNEDFSISYHYVILRFTKDAYKLNKYDFEKYKGEKKKPIFYDYDSEWGYFERDVKAWMEIPQYEEEE